jgi:dual specificity phosphatase 12
VAPQEPIGRYFPQMTAAIRDAVASREAVLIHCAAGMSRSVSIAAAYLIAAGGLSAADAVAAIKRARPIADPNKGFMEQLEGFSKTPQ